MRGTERILFLKKKNAMKTLSFWLLQTDWNYKEEKGEKENMKWNPTKHRWKHWIHESTPLDKPVTHITRPAKGALDRTREEDEAGDTGSIGWRPLNEDENSLEHPLPPTTSTIPSPPIAATKTVNKIFTIHHIWNTSTCPLSNNQKFTNNDFKFREKQVSDISLAPKTLNETKKIKFLILGITERTLKWWKKSKKHKIEKLKQKGWQSWRKRMNF